MKKNWPVVTLLIFLLTFPTVLFSQSTEAETPQPKTLSEELSLNLEDFIKNEIQKAQEAAVKEALIPHLLRERELENERDAMKVVQESISRDLQTEREGRIAAEKRSAGNFWKGITVGSLVTGGLLVTIYLFMK